MSIIKDVTLDERNTPVTPDEFRTALICETQFNFVEDEKLCENYATDLFK
jgi:hypothetical protein